MTDIAASPLLGGREAPGPHPVRPNLVLTLVLVGQFMALLDVSVVNVAVATIQDDLHAGGSALELVVSGYTIVYAVFLITSARLGERWGYDRMYTGGVALFTLASLACGLAPNVEFLIAFRLIQGLGAAVMVPQVMSLLQRTFTGPARIRALGLYTAVLSSGMVVGQLLGGVLVDVALFGSGWRPIFLINVPIGVVLLIAGRGRLPRTPRSQRALDPVGLVLLSLAVALIVVPLVLGHERGWPLWGWIMLTVGLICVAALAISQHRIARRGGSPLLRGRVLAAPGFAATGLAVCLTMAGVAGFMFSVGLYLQAGLGQSPLRVGLTFGPMAAGFGLAGATWRKLPPRLHPRLALPALLVYSAGYGLMAWDLHDGSPMSVTVRVVTLFMGGLVGIAYGQLFASALATVRVEDAADASGIMVTLVQLGNVLGVAVIGTLFFNALGSPGPNAPWGHAAAVACWVVAGVSVAAALSAGIRDFHLHRHVTAPSHR
jgi:MFS family permease